MGYGMLYAPHLHTSSVFHIKNTEMALQQDIYI